MQFLPIFHPSINCIDDVAVIREQLCSFQTSMTCPANKHQCLVARKLLWIYFNFMQSYIPGLGNLAQGTGQLFRCANIDQQEIRIRLHQQVETIDVNKQHFSLRR